MGVFVYLGFIDVVGFDSEKGHESSEIDFLIVMSFCGFSLVVFNEHFS